MTDIIKEDSKKDRRETTSSFNKPNTSMSFKRSDSKKKESVKEQIYDNKNNLLNMSNQLLNHNTTHHSRIKKPEIIENKGNSKRRDFLAGPAVRNEKIEADKYYKVVEENEKLKNYQENLNLKFKELQTQLYQAGEKMIKERAYGEKKVIYLEEGSEIEMLNLRNENEKLKDQLKKTKTVIKGMQVKDRYSSSTGMKNLIHAKGQIESTNTHNEYLKLIKELKFALNDKDAEIKRLHSELYGQNKKTKGFEEYTTDLKDRNLKMNELELKSEQLQMQLETNTKIMKHLEETTKDFQGRWRDEQKKANELKTENANLKANLERLPEYVSMIDEYKKRELDFEARISNLCESPFIKQAEERGNVYRKLQETEALLREQGIDYKKMKESMQEYNSNLKRLKEDNEMLKKEKDQYKEDAMRLKITNEEREKNTKNFSEQLNLLSQYGEVDSNFTRILSMLKLKDDDTSWMKVEFFDRLGESNLKNPEFLLKEIEKLIQEKGELGRQVEISKNVQLLQQKLIDDMKKEREELEKITNFQINELKKKCEQYAKRNDFEKRGGKNVALNKEYYLKDNIINDDFSQHIVDDVTEFTRDDNESVLGINENAIDLYIGEASFEDILSTELGIKISDMLSFTTVDFYMHEIQTSNISSGQRPWYNLQLKLIVNEDEHLIKYIESEEGIKLELFYIKDNLHSLFGYGYIPLSQLLENEGMEENGKRTINNVCSIFYKNNPNLLIGNVHYKMRMRQSMLESLKWFREKMRLIDDISPVQKITDKKAKDNISMIQGLSKGKVMQVTLMLTKLDNLIVSGPPREIRPYVWYQFYKSEDHFTKTFNGNNTLLEDINVISAVYDSAFDDYIQNGELCFMVLDDYRPIEVRTTKDNDTKGEMHVDIIENPEVDDLIGICTIKLKDLILQDKIQNSFPIINRNGKKAGELSVLIFWEQVILAKNNKLNNVPYDTNLWEEDLIIKLGEKLKQKKLTVESAFEFFNIDNEETLSASNFRHVLMSQLKYMNNNEVSSIIDILFNSSNFLSRLTFSKFFLPLLSSSKMLTDDDKKETKNITVTIKHDMEKVNNTISNLVEEKASVVNIQKQESKVDLGINRKSSMPEDYELNYKSTENNKVLSQSPQKDTFKKKSTKGLITKDGWDYKTDSDRPNNEIMLLMADYSKRTNKNSISEIFKLFDKDINSFINKKEVLNGFVRVGIPLSKTELDRVWEEMIETNKNLDKVDLSLFKRFFERYDIIRKK